MNQKLSHIDFDQAGADVFCFDNGTQVREYHAIIRVQQACLPFAQQVEAVLNAYNSLLAQLPGAQAVFKRYFLSDAANQQNAHRYDGDRSP